ncbi:MAG TPA: ABC transporter ATP-binding protein [Anaerolineales bacterium]|nr:ABC transporter ATP-binding protein [Anaerolineales bacterium]
MMGPGETERAGDVLVNIQRVTYTHWNQASPTLREVSLRIKRATLNVLVGPGGSGKSTLCDLFNGVIPHLSGGSFEGDVWIDGVNTREVEVKDLAPKVGRVFQDPEIMFATLFVEDEIAFGPENLRFDVATILSVREKLLADTNLAPRRHHLVWNLSGGQIQKLGLASVLAMQPQMIVLDEPTSNLDPAATRNVHEMVLSLRREGITVLLVTRELDEFLAEADQLFVMAEGRLVTSGRPHDVLREQGDYMVDSLGVWLPETSELGIALKREGLIKGAEIPITVHETLSMLEREGLLARLGADESGLSAVHRSTPTIGDILLSGKDLRYAYPGGTEALRGVSLDIRAGDWLMILGRNGAGKSTLASMMVGLLRPQHGELVVSGRPIQRWKVQDLANHIALVFQNPEHQFLTDSVSDEIGYSLLAHGFSSGPEVERQTGEMLELLGLRGVADRHPLALSAGLKRRLGVATMLVGKPQVLLVDEPTYGQDKAMTHTLMALMQEIRATGVAVVMITHDMRLVQEYAERVVVMSEGVVLYDGPSAGLFDRADILAGSNLRRTILHELLAAMRQAGLPFLGEVRRTSDLVDRLRVKDPAE